MTIKEFKESEIKRMMVEGKSVQEIGNSLGISRQAVWLWLKDNGYTIERKWTKERP